MAPQSVRRVRPSVLMLVGTDAVAAVHDGEHLELQHYGRRNCGRRLLKITRGSRRRAAPGGFGPVQTGYVGAFEVSRLPAHHRASGRPSGFYQPTTSHDLLAVERQDDIMEQAGWKAKGTVCGDACHGRRTTGQDARDLLTQWWTTRTSVHVYSLVWRPDE